MRTLYDAYRRVAAPDSPFPKLFVAPSIALIILPTDPQPSPQTLARPALSLVPPYLSSSSSTSSPSTRKSTSTKSIRTAAIEACTIATMRSTQELPQRFLRMSRAYWVPKPPSKAGMHHRRTKYNRCFHLHAGPERARHAHTMHEPNMIERMKGLSGSRIWHHPRPTVPFTASPRGGGHVRAAVSVTLPDALRRSRALLFNGARDQRRSLNGDRNAP